MSDVDIVTPEDVAGIGFKRKIHKPERLKYFLDLTKKKLWVDAALDEPLSFSLSGIQIRRNIEHFVKRLLGDILNKEL